MRKLLAFLCCLVFVIIATGCASLEHSRAVKRGDTPWYVVRITSPDTEIQAGEMRIYKLLRQADSPEGQKEGLQADKLWGEGHGEIERKDHGTIMTHAQISWDQSDSKTCIFQVSAVYQDKKEPFMFSFESIKLDPCEKVEFENPYFSGLIQTEDREWRTLNFEFRRWSDAN